MADHRRIIVALDEGTSNAKAVAIDADGQVLCQFSHPLSVQTPQAGWVEQRGEALIAQSLAVMREVIGQVGGDNVAARSNTPELSAIGAGLLARKALDGLDDGALAPLLPQHDIFTPDADRHARLQESWRNWQTAVERTLWRPQVTRGMDVTSNNVEMK